MRPILTQLLDCPGESWLQPALVTSSPDCMLTYDELSERVRDLAACLEGAGVTRGTRVVLVFGNGPELVQLLLAVNSLGAVAAPLNPAYTAREYAFFLDDIRPSFVIVPAGEFTVVGDLAGPDVRVFEAFVSPPKATVVLRSGGKKLRKSRSAAEEPSPDDAALLLHTSGTTARPKQVPLLHRNLVATTRHIVDHYALTENDVTYCVMPLFHVHGLVASVFATLMSGGTVVLPRRVSPRRFRYDLLTRGVTWFTSAPTLLRMLLDGAAAESPPAVPSLRFARTCSSPLALELQLRAEHELGVPVLEAYGMTEAAHQISANPLPPGECRPGTVGIGTGTQIRVVDATGGEVPFGTTGEVVIMGPGVMPGYLRNPEANAEGFFGSWFRTGDLGVMEDGYLRLRGRLKEMILRGGENVSPYEIEAVLLGFPGVVDAVCFGVPDRKYGELVAAAVSVDVPLDQGELIRHCRERLAAYKVPSAIRTVDVIPRTATGKLQRSRMASLLAEDRAVGSL